VNEKQLKLLFCKALASGHIKGNDLIPTKECKLRIIEEAHLRSFDLLIAAIGRNEPNSRSNYDNLLVRTQLLKHVAITEKCQIDHIRFFPVEIKSDEDILDDRLPNQIIDAILTFGLSILVLDKNHSDKAKKLGKLLPTTTICYTGVEDYFEVTSRFGRFVSSGVLAVNKTALAKMLGNTSARTYSRLVTLQRILEKLAFNQLFFEKSLTDEEMQFLKALIDVPMPAGQGKHITKLIIETSNMKLTDYL
jgi:hypothetical protein